MAVLDESEHCPIIALVQHARGDLQGIAFHRTHLCSVQHTLDLSKMQMCFANSEHTKVERRLADLQCTQSNEWKPEAFPGRLVSVPVIARWPETDPTLAVLSLALSLSLPTLTFC